MEMTLVSNGGVFTMYGGEIRDNRITTDSDGGGVDNGGVFKMFGGKISNNVAANGGGVSNSGIFELYNGEISGNTARGQGGGVHHNDKQHGYGVFTMFNGQIINNNAVQGGGVYNSGNFSIINSVISGNTATTHGGGVYNYGEGGGFYNSGNLTIVDCVFSNNVALTGDGGGIWIIDPKVLFVPAGVIFENNRAATAYNRTPNDDALYDTNIKCTVWTSPFTQGYNNYDISYTKGQQITFSVTVQDSYAATTGAGVYYRGTQVTINAGSRNGYTFSGWTVTEGGVTVTNNPTTTFIMPTNDVVLTANWSPTQYTISYTMNGGTNVAGNPSSYTLESLPCTISNPSRADYDFTGWTVRYVNGTEVTGQNNYRIPVGTMGDVVFTANWSSRGSSGGGGSGGSGGGSSGGSPSKPSPSTSTPSNPVPSETAPPGGGNNISPSPDDKETPVWSLTMVALIVVTIALAITVVTSVLLWQKTRKNNS